MTGNIEFIDLIINKTQNVTVIGYLLIHRAQRRIIASKERNKINGVNKISIILESELKNNVIETYLKMKILMMWRNFFKNIAETGDYVYN